MHVQKETELNIQLLVKNEWGNLLGLSIKLFLLTVKELIKKVLKYPAILLSTIKS